MSQCLNVMGALWPENGASCAAGNLKLENDAAGKLETEELLQQLENWKLENLFGCLT